MAEIVKVLGSEAALSTASNVGSASVVRILNNNAGLALVTRANSSGTTIGTITLAAGEIVYLQKVSSDTLASNVAVRAVSVSFN